MNRNFDPKLDPHFLFPCRTERRLRITCVCFRLLPHPVTHLPHYFRTPRILPTTLYILSFSPGLIRHDLSFFVSYLFLLVPEVTRGSRVFHVRVKSRDTRINRMSQECDVVLPSVYLKEMCTVRPKSLNGSQCVDLGPGRMRSRIRTLV